MITVQRAVVEEVQEIRRLLSETWIDTYSSFSTPGRNTENDGALAQPADPGL